MENDPFAPGFFDEDTGFNTPEYEASEVEAQAAEIIKANSSTEALALSPDWEKVNKFIEEEVYELLKFLKIEQDHSKILRIQSLIYALEYIPKIFEKVLVDTQKARQLLTQYTNNETTH